MKRNISIQLKAALLLVVFGLNTLVGFACAIGIDMRFNTTHHHNEEATEVHVHGNGEKHEHDKKSANHHHEEENEKSGCQAGHLPSGSTQGLALYRFQL